jgi:hypothetical protein
VTYRDGKFFLFIFVKNILAFYRKEALKNQNLVYASHSNNGRDFNTSRPAYGLL